MLVVFYRIVLVVVWKMGYSRRRGVVVFFYRRSKGRVFVGD